MNGSKARQLLVELSMLLLVSFVVDLVRGDFGGRICVSILAFFVSKIMPIYPKSWKLLLTRS